MLAGMLAKTVNKTEMNVCHKSYLHTGQAARNKKGLAFYLLYGRDAKLPSDEIINAMVSHRGATNLDDYT